MWTKIKDKIAAAWQFVLVWAWKCISYVGARFLYGPFSKLWRWAFERKYTKLPPDYPWTTDQLLQFFSECTWKADAWGGALDVVSKPEKFYETKTGDCDEYAVFGNRVLPWKSFILSVTWFDPDASWFEKFKGHNVCVYYYKKKWWHIGNWGKEGPFNRLRDVWYDIPPKGTIPCVYSCRGQDLKWFAGGILVDKK